MADEVILTASCDQGLKHPNRFVVRVIVGMGTPNVWHSYNGTIDKSYIYISFKI